MLKFGVFDHMDRGRSNLRAHFEDRLSLIEEYDRRGFHAYHVAEHHSTPLGCAPSPSVFLGAIAQRTKTLRFGPLVYALSLYHPLRLFEEICMLDQMSGGRIELGIGRGISPIELGFYGVAASDAQGIYLEASEIIFQAFRSQRLNFDGFHFRFKDVPIELKPIQLPHPPLWVGVSRPEGLEWAAHRHVNVVCNGRVEQVAEIRNLYKRHCLESSAENRSAPMIGMSRHIVVAPSRDEAWSIGARAYTSWHKSLMHLWRANGALPSTLSFPEEFADAVGAGYCIVGSPDEVRANVQDQVGRTGVNYLLCRFAFGDLSFSESLRSVQLFDDHIMKSFSQ